MTGNEPSEDPSEAPTGMYDYSSQEEGDAPPDLPWYRRPIVSLTAALLAAILFGLVIYLLADRNHGGGTSKQTPTSPTLPAVSTPVTTLPPTTEPAAPPTTTTMTFPPNTSEPTASATPSPTGTSIQGHHHHHHHDGGTP